MDFMDSNDVKAIDASEVRLPSPPQPVEPFVLSDTARLGDSEPSSAADVTAVDSPPTITEADLLSAQLSSVVLETLLRMSGLRSHAAHDADEDTPAATRRTAAPAPVVWSDARHRTGSSAAATTQAHNLLLSGTSFTKEVSCDKEQEAEKGSVELSATQRNAPHTPVQQRMPAPHAEAARVGRHDISEQPQGLLSISGEHVLTRSAGLMSTARAASSTAAMPPSSQRVGDSILVVDHAKGCAYATAAAPSAEGGVATPHSINVDGATMVEGLAWQLDFAAHAQDILRETQKQVEVLRRYQTEAARQAQRADLLADAQRVLEAKLVTAEQRRSQEEVAHKAAVAELSRQVLQLDQIVAALRRSQRELRRQLQDAHDAAAVQRTAYAARIEHVTRQYRVKMEVMQRDGKRAQESSNELQQGVPRSRSASHDAGPPSHLTLSADGEPVAASNRVTADSTTTTAGVTTPSENSAGLAVTAPAADQHHTAQLIEEPVSAALPYERVHPDVLAQQQLREQTLTSQLLLLEARLQREVAQRRQAEQRVEELLLQNEALQEGVASAATEAPATFTQGEEVDSTSECTADGDHPVAYSPQQPLETEDVQRELREARQKLASMEEEKADLAQRYMRQQRDQAEQWAAVRHSLQSILTFAGVEESAFVHVTDDTRYAVSALQHLAEVLPEQKRLNAAAHAQTRESVRLATLQQALHHAEEQDAKYRVTLEATEAQLQDARSMLAQWQRQQQHILRQQQQRDAEWHAAEVGLTSVVVLLQQALQELTQQQRHRTAGVSARPIRPTSSKTIGALARKARQSAATSLGNVAPHLSSSTASGTESSTSSNVAIDGVPLTEKAPTVRIQAGVHDAASTASESTPSLQKAPEQQHGQVGVVKTPTRTGDGDAGSAEEKHAASSLSVYPLTRTTSVTIVAYHLELIVGALQHHAQALLTAWRTQQRRLHDSTRRWKSTAEDALSANAVLQKKHQLQVRRLMQRLRRMRRTEQQQTRELEELKRDWAAAQEQQAAKHKAEVRSCQEAAARERNAVLRRLRVVEEAAQQAQHTLITGDVERRALQDTVKQLEGVQAEADAARKEAQRRQSDLTTHIEDLEERLQVSQKAEVGLRALLKAAVSAVVHLLLRWHCLRHQYKTARAFCDRAEYLVTTVQHITVAALRAVYDAKDTGSVVPRLSWTATSPTQHLRVCVRAIQAAHRLQRLCQLRQEVLRSALSSMSDTAACRLPTALALYGVSSAGLMEMGLTGASRGSGVWPAVWLPQTSELVTPVLPLLLGNVDAVQDDFSERGVPEGSADSDESAAILSHRSSSRRANSATTASTQLLLEHLLSATLLDTHAACNRFELAAVSASTAIATHAQHLAQQTKAHRAELRTRLLQRGGAGTICDLSSTSFLLPPPLADPLQQLLSRTTTQARELLDVKAMVQRLVSQNQRLVSAVETQTQLDDTRAAEMGALAAQVALHDSQRHEETVLQEKLVQSRASLLQERQLRRDAEDQLAQLRQQQLQWMGETEQLKREVYALNVELANTTTTTAMAAATRESSSSPPQPVYSLLNTSQRAADPTTGSGATARTPKGHVPAQGKRSTDDTNYYHQLLRGSRKDVCEGTPLHYQPRHNIPTADELTAQIPSAVQGHYVTSSPVSARRGDAVAKSDRISGGGGLELFVPKVVRAQQRQQQQQQQRKAQQSSVESDRVAVDALSSLRECEVRGGGGSNDLPSSLSSPPSPATSIRVAISPSQAKTPATRMKHYAPAAAAGPSHLRERTPPLSIFTATSLSTPPSEYVRQRPSQPPPPSPSSARTVVAQDDGDTLHDRPSLATLEKSWAPLKTTPTPSTISSGGSLPHTSPSAPLSTTAASLASGLARLVTSREVSERSVTQAPPAVRPSVPASTSLSSLSPLTANASSASSSHDRERSQATATGGPVYFIQRNL
jgi:hypothetical protein